MVVAYLSESGSKEVMFRPGYHMNAFLIDFLQYYHNRPAFARNCLYEDELRSEHPPKQSRITQCASKS